ncbi:adhesion G protein-coupled receptor L3-like isoform X1 [Mytilus edulis]|uniref:adhesion G protein-coupled receptor L3-like isoform X1 n=1 Tax=Mytilus edulis TaxID=6550 RepID=UPI0039EE628F
MKTGLVLYIFVSFLLWICESLKCEDPWVLLRRNCVLYEKTNMLPWKEAQQTCEEYGGNLISVNSHREKQALQRGIMPRIKKPNELYWWVGLSHNRAQARWIWQDGSFLSLRSRYISRSPWAAGEPDNRGGNELCADFHFSGKMFDKDCSERKPFICQRIKITPAPRQTKTTTSSNVLSYTPTFVSTLPPETTVPLQTSEISTQHEKISTQQKTTSTSNITKTSVVSMTSKSQTKLKLLAKTTTPPPKLTASTVSASKPYKTTPAKLTKPTVSAPLVNRIPECPGVFAYGIQWPATRIAATVKQPCPETAGYATWTCVPDSGWKEQPNLTECSSSDIQRINKMVDSVINHKSVPTTEDMVSIAANLTESVVTSYHMTAADISTSTAILHQMAKAKPKNVKETETMLKEVVKAGNYLFSKTESSKNIEADDKERAASDLLFVMEDTALGMTDSLQTTASISTKTEKIYVSLNVININSSTQDLEYNNGEEGTSFIIPYSVLQKYKIDGLVKAVFMTHYNLGNILKINDDTVDVEVASNIVSASIAGDKTIEFPLSPVIFTIQLSRTYGEAAQPLCSFWNFSEGVYGQWSQEGCNRIKENATHVTCQCTHLTNFAILMDVSGVKLTNEHTQFLRYITFVGCIISIACLALSWITFQCVRSLDGERNSIHKNLVFCLFAAELIFIVGIDRTDDRVSCAAIALLLHFFFLSSFMWMLMEGVHIVVLLQQVFDAAKNNMRYYYLAGYGVSITIVGTTAGINFKAYGTEDFCWITTDQWFIWSFTGPVAVILIINTIVLMYALSMVCRHSAYVFAREKSQQSNFRAWIQGAFAVEVLLGSTWVFGYFFINESTVVFAYIFTVLNSIQGLFIFIFHCLLNKKIRFEYKKLAHVHVRHNSQSSTKSASFKKKDGSYEVYVSTS